MITVVDQVRPWLIPSSTLAATTHPPAGRPDQQQRNGNRDQPAGDQHGLAAVPLRPGSGDVVGQGLGDAEREDVGECGGRTRGEDLGRQQRQDGAFLAEHAADQCVDRDEQAELGEVGPQAECRWAMRSRPVTDPAPARGPGARATVVGSAIEDRRGRLRRRGRAGWPRSSRVRRDRTSRRPVRRRRSAACSARSPSSMWAAPGRCPAAYSPSCRMSSTGTPDMSVGETRSIAAVGRPAVCHASMPPAISPAMLA